MSTPASSLPGTIPGGFPSSNGPPYVRGATKVSAVVNAIAWQPFTEYVANQLATNAGTTYIANFDHVSAGTFSADAIFWTAIGSSAGGGSFVQQGSQVVCVDDAAYNPVASALRIQDGAMTSGLAVLTTASWATFQAGMRVYVNGAGAISGSNTHGVALRATVLSSTSAGVVLDTVAVTTCTAMQVDYGFSAIAQWTAAVAALSALGGGDLISSQGKNYLFDVDAISSSWPNIAFYGGGGSPPFHYAIQIPSNVRVRMAQGSSIRLPFNGDGTTTNSASAFYTVATNTELDIDVDGCGVGPAFTFNNETNGHNAIIAFDNTDTLKMFNCRWHHLYGKGLIVQGQVTAAVRVTAAFCHAYKNMGQFGSIVGVNDLVLAHNNCHDNLSLGAEAVILGHVTNFDIDGLFVANQGTAVSCTNTCTTGKIRGVIGDSGANISLAGGTAGTVLTDIEITGCTVPGIVIGSGNTAIQTLRIVGGTFAGAIIADSAAGSGTAIDDVSIVGSTITSGGITAGSTSFSSNIKIVGVTVEGCNVALRGGVTEFSGTISNGALNVGCSNAKIEVAINAGTANNGEAITIGGASNTVHGTVTGTTPSNSYGLVRVTGAGATGNVLTGCTLTMGGTSANGNIVIWESGGAAANQYINNPITPPTNWGYVVVTAVASSIVRGNPGYNTIGSGDYGPVVATVTQAAAPAIDTDNMTVASITGLAQAITGFTMTGGPVDGQSLIVRLTDNGTGRAITWGSSFEASTVALPTTTVASTMLITGFLWNAATSKWRCVAVA